MTAIILVEPQMGENIGAAARVMYNFGFDDLRIVNPRDGWPNEKALEMSAGAKEVIRNATVLDTMSDALEGIAYSFAVTARMRDINVPIESLSSAFDRKNITTDMENGAFVFGAERSGLSNEQVSYCDAVLTIPTHDVYPSLNLAQAVGVVCYQYGVKRISVKGDSVSLSEKMDKKEMAVFVDFLITSLEEKGFYSIPDKQKAMEINLRTMFMQMELTPQELQSLWGVIKCLQA